MRSAEVQRLSGVVQQQVSTYRENRRLPVAVQRLPGLADQMQDEARDNVSALPTAGPTSFNSGASSKPEVAETVIHRLVSMGVFVPHGSVDNEDQHQEDRGQPLKAPSLARLRISVPHPPSRSSPAWGQGRRVTQEEAAWGC